jgi:hypothetical protein
MSIAHRIDEFVFDCSFDSLAQANALEPEMSTLLISGLLPVIDSILNEFDEADTVWRLDQVEIDLGDIANDDFHTKLMQCVQEKLREKLLRLQEHHRSPDSALIKQLPVQRLSKLQTDLEILRDFLLTGRMPWSIDTTDRYAHENMLQRILQRQEGQEAWITLLKRLTAAERAVAISRLVSQFSYRSLERVLAGISPVAANPLLDFLQIYQQAASAAGVKTAVQTERTRPAWEQLFKMLLESKPSPGNWAALLDQLIKTIVPQHTQESSAMLESINRTAAQYYKDGKISGAFHDALQTVSSLYSQHPQRESMNHPTSLTHRNGSHNAARSEPEGIKSNEEIKREAQPETAVSPGRKKHARQTEAAHEELYARIMEALQKAGLIDAGFASLLIGLPPIDRRQRLHSLLQSPAVKPRLPQLPQAALLDIGIWLSPQAALLNEHLLAHADKLQRSTATSAGSSRTQWEQRLWSASLNYLLAETDSDIVPAAYVQALARGVSGETDSQVTLRAWYDALEQSKAFGAVHTLLQPLFSATQEKDRASAAQHTSVPPEAVTKTQKREDDDSPETAALFERGKHARQTEAAHEELYTRIVEALQKAGVIDAGFASLLMGLPPVERRQRLRGLLQLPAVKPRLPQLPQAALLDIGYWLSPPAALLMERLLAHASRLYQLPATTGRTTQKHWKQQRWSAALDYLLRQTDSPGATGPAGLMRALAHGVPSKAAEAQITLRAWYEALAHSEPHSIIVTLLRTLIDEAPEPGKPAEENAPQQQLHDHFTAGKAIPGQQDLTALLQAPATGTPEQLHQLYQDLRNGRYDLAAVQLSASELRSLIEKLLHIQSGAAGADQSVFLQAIAAQADQADDQATYYRLILEDLLREREIDLEAIAALARQPLGKVQNDEESRGKQTGMEAFKRAGEAEEARTAGQATPEVAARTAAYPTRQSTKPIHTGHLALYSRITAALHEAGLIDQHPETISTEVQSGELKQHLRAMLRGIDMNGWMEKLPQSVRTEIAYLLSPQAALLNEHLLAHADKLQRATSAGSSRTQWEQRLWSASLNYLLAETDSDIVPAAYVQALARGVSDQADSRSTLRDWYDALEQNKTSAAIRTLLQTIAEASAVPPRMGREDEENPDSNRSVAGTVENAAAAQKPPLLDWDALLHRAQSTDDVREEIYIENAGQVLAAPYLPRLFSMLKLVEGGAFVDRHAAERAVHLLQFMVNEQTRSPEYQLTLNKILCGVKTGIPICAEIDISAHEQETIEGLIRGMIQNWKTIGNTSISGLRETFLQRKGKLQLKEDGMWYLTVEPGVFDMLLDSLPWSYSVIKHSWMERAVHVTWR